MHKKLYRTKDGKILTGLCAGLGKYFDINPWIIRILLLLFAATLFCIVLYFVISYFVPCEGDDQIEAKFYDPDEKQ